MSSEVQQKWMSSARPRSCSDGAIVVRRRLRKYSTALTSCWVTRSIVAHLGDLVGAEVLDHLPQGGLLGLGEGAHAGDDVPAGEVDQPLDLDAHALAVQGRLREVLDERGHGGAVAAVESSEGDGRGRVSKRGHGPHPPRAGEAPVSQPP